MCLAAIHSVTTGIVFVGQTILEPTVTVHYAENGKEELKYIWNVQNRIYKGRMQPGGGTSDNGFIFPDEDFFMQLDWWSERAAIIASASPQNGRTPISIST